MVADEHCRVTVVGQTRRVSLALPATAPIAEYSATLATLCGQADDDGFPAVWSLAAVGGSTLPLTSSLEQAGVADGQILYLRDAALGEADEPAVMDLDEAVTDASGQLYRWAWNPRNRVLTGAVLGLCWLTAVLIAAACWPPARDARPVSGLALLAGLVCSGLGAIAARRQWPVPLALTLALALSAVPDLAVSAVTAAHPSSFVVLAAGALIGALLALAAVPDTLTAMALVLVIITVFAAAALAAAKASAAQSAALAALIVLVLAALGPWLAARATAYSPFEPAVGADAGVVSHQVRRGWVLSAQWTTVVCLAGAIDLIWLATSANWYAQAQAGTVGAALVLGAAAHRQLIGVVANLVAGSAALLTLALELPARLHIALWTGTAVATLAGFGILATALARSFSRADTFGPQRGSVSLILLRAVSVALAVGMFGVFAHLQSLGHRL